MKKLKKQKYSIFDFYVFMEETHNYLKCIYPYEFKNLSILNYIINGDLHIENRVIPFEIDSIGIINGANGCSNSIIIDKYIFTLL